MPSVADASAAVVALPAVLTQHEARSALVQLLQALALPGRQPAGQTLVLDGQALQRFDSTTLAVLLECRREALQRGHSLRVQALPDGLWKLAGLYGVQGLLDPHHA